MTEEIIEEPTPVYEIGVLTLSDGQEIEVKPITEGDSYIDYRRMSGGYKGICTLQLSVTSETNAPTEITNELEKELVSKTKQDHTLEELQESLCKQVNTIRYSKIYQDSIPYTFPGDTEPDGIQMRDEKDRQNIQDFVIDATTKDPAAEMTWMPVSNNPKTLTAAQAIEMGQMLKARGDQIMAYSWQLKSQIMAAVDVASLPDIEAGWPA